MQPIIKHIETSHVFQLNTDGTYTNLTTGNNGTLTRETAKDKFVVPILANDLIIKNPLIIDMIKDLGLIMEK